MTRNKEGALLSKAYSHRPIKAWLLQPEDVKLSMIENGHLSHQMMYVKECLQMKMEVFYTNQDIPGHRLVEGGGMFSKFKLFRTVFEHLVFPGRRG